MVARTAPLPRAPAVVFLALVIVLAGGTVLAHHVRGTRTADAALREAGTGITSRLQGFHRLTAAYPSTVRLRRDAVELSGASTTRTDGIALDPDISLVWYTNEPDPRLSTGFQQPGGGYSFCLSSHGRHWRGSATTEGVTTGGPADGGCPSAPAS